MTRKSRTVGNFAAGGGNAARWIREHVSYQGDECLIWPFGKASNGYGSLSYMGRRHSAHRLMCELARGDEHEMLAIHSCGNGHLGCVNPRHLRWGNNEENMADKVLHDTHTRGERQWAARLTEASVREIRSSLGSMSQAAIARKYDVSRSTIAGIAQRKTWAWL